MKRIMEIAKVLFNDNIQVEIKKILDTEDIQYKTKHKIKNDIKINRKEEEISIKVSSVEGSISLYANRTVTNNTDYTFIICKINGEEVYNTLVHLDTEERVAKYYNSIFE